MEILFDVVQEGSEKNQGCTWDTHQKGSNSRRTMAISDSPNGLFDAIFVGTRIAEVFCPGV